LAYHYDINTKLVAVAAVTAVTNTGKTVPAGTHTKTTPVSQSAVVTVTLPDPQIYNFEALYVVAHAVIATALSQMIPTGIHFLDVNIIL